MHHDEKYLLINNAFAGKQRLMPFINRTDGTDAFDILYIGAEKFPFHDTFALSSSGIV